jgi:hypothetical protein
MRLTILPELLLTPHSEEKPAQAGADCVSFAPVPMGQETPVPPSPQ